MSDASLLSGELKLAGRLDARFFALLDAIEATGSLTRGARTAGYSYRGAWLLLEAAAALALDPLVESSTGGVRGGGSRLTPAARALRAAWTELQTRHRAFLRTQEAQLLQDPALAGILRRLSMKSTARNQFPGRITALDIGPVSAEVVVTLAGGQDICATVTSASARAMGMAVGQAAIALIKTSAVVLVTDFAGYALSARNQLAGTVSRVERGAVSSLVGVTLPGGAVVTATVTNDAVDALALDVGQSATAVFKAYAVMVAVAAGR